ncbi:hypothetical protein [Oscillatoria acuminata]|uniref:Uncharacterized protein n=1 Tax=Oscillatoria acuminata PCC 6304 TaxID=56110 RepID=K9TLA0_9CYAN|nr:hypothetical protein [Oscillatoria acuminata]AFY83647.1 hypothetical protein Oscil6304_4118 [Oscillatoria acuminata PCC 6304]
MVELMIVLDEWILKNTVLAWGLFWLLFCFVCWIFFIPLSSHVCTIRSVVKIKQSFQCLEGSSFLDSGYGIVYTIISLNFYVLGWMNLVYRKNNRAMVRLINWLVCGIGACLGYWFHFIIL